MAPNNSLDREVLLLEEADAANGAPTIDDETEGFARPFASDQAVVCVWSTAGSDTMVVQVRIWGFETNLDRWFDLGIINDGTDIAEVATDTISHAEGLAGLRAFDRFYAEVVSIGGTATAVNVALVFTRSGPVTVS